MAVLCALMLAAGVVIGRATVALPAAAKAGTATSSPFSRFAGSWSHHGGGLFVDPSGQAVHRFRTYVNCTGTRLTACDRLTSNNIYDGGYTSFTLTRVSGKRAYGYVNISSFSWQIGRSVTLILKANNTMDLYVMGDLTPVCGPRAPAGACGA